MRTLTGLQPIEVHNLQTVILLKAETDAINFKLWPKILSMKKAELNKTDALAIERTRLANERTFLAYFRTSIVFLSSGFAIIKINALKEITDIGYFLLVIAPILFLIGLFRFLYVRKKVKKYFFVDVPGTKS